MRIVFMLMLTLFLAACAATTKVPSSDVAMAKEAEMLVRYSLTDRLVDNVQSYNREQIASFLVGKGVPEEEANRIVDEEMQDLLPTEHQRLVDALVPIYQRFYTPAEIHQLLSFYKTDVARKSAEVSSQIAAEGRDFIRVWNENLGEKLLEQVALKVEAAEFPEK